MYLGFTSIVVQVLIMGLLHSLALRAAVWLYNRVCAAVAHGPHANGSSTNSLSDSTETGNAATYEVAEAGPYTSPAHYSTSQVRGPKGPVPTPSFLRAFCIGGIVSATQVLLFVGTLLVLFAALGSTVNTVRSLGFAPLVMSLGAGIAITMVLLQWMVPTSIRAAAAVTGICYGFLISFFALLATTMILFA